MVCQVLSNGWFNRNWWYLTSVTNIPTQLFIISWTRPFSCNLAKNHCRKTWVMMTIRNVILYIHRRTRSLSRVPGFPFQDSFLQFQKKKAEKEAWKKQLREGFWKGLLKQKGEIATGTAVVQGSCSTQVERERVLQQANYTSDKLHASSQFSKAAEKLWLSHITFWRWCSVSHSWWWCTVWHQWLFGVLCWWHVMPFEAMTCHIHSLL